MSQTFIIASHVADRAGPHQDLYLSTTEDALTYMSWAIPKGVPLKKGVKHLAVRVGDHSPSAAMFEGEITEGYGKGVKEIWDEGTYVPYQHIVAPKPVRIDFFGGRVIGTYYLKHWADKRWLIWRA